MGRDFEIGWVWVDTICKKPWTPKPVNRNVKYYLVKYLNKRQYFLSKGVRHWSTVGGFKGVKVKNLEVNSPFHRNMKAITGGTKAPFAFAKEVMHMSKIDGDLHHEEIAYLREKVGQYIDVEQSNTIGQTTRYNEPKWDGKGEIPF